MLLAAAALLLRASGAPLEEPAGGETSGEGGEETSYPPDTLNIFNTWDLVIASTEQHKKEVRFKKNKFKQNI